jgi:hypothetical protein
VGLGDVWHRTLVYFGIAEEYEETWDDSYESDELVLSSQTEPAYVERPATNVRRLPRRRSDAEDFDDWTTPSEPRERRRVLARGLSPRRQAPSRRCTSFSHEASTTRSRSPTA